MPDKLFVNILYNYLRREGPGGGFSVYHSTSVQSKTVRMCASILINPTHFIDAQWCVPGNRVANMHMMLILFSRGSQSGRDDQNVNRTFQLVHLVIKNLLKTYYVPTLCVASGNLSVNKTAKGPKVTVLKFQ